MRNDDAGVANAAGQRDEIVPIARDQDAVAFVRKREDLFVGCRRGNDLAEARSLGDGMHWGQTAGCMEATGRVGRALCLLLGVLWTGGCDGDSPEVPGPTLSDFEKTVVEEIVFDHLSDLFWVTGGSHGGAFPRLAFAFSLPGVDYGRLGSVTSDASFEPMLFEPSCDASQAEEILHCLRIRRHEAGDWELQVYYTRSPDQTPRAQPDVSYAGENQVATVRFAPQPYRS